MNIKTIRGSQANQLLTKYFPSYFSYTAICHSLQFFALVFTCRHVGVCNLLRVPNIHVVSTPIHLFSRTLLLLCRHRRQMYVKIENVLFRPFQLCSISIYTALHSTVESLLVCLFWAGLSFSVVCSKSIFSLILMFSQSPAIVVVVHYTHLAVVLATHKHFTFTVISCCLNEGLS